MEKVHFEVVDAEESLDESFAEVESLLATYAYPDHVIIHPDGERCPHGNRVSVAPSPDGGMEFVVPCVECEEPVERA